MCTWVHDHREWDRRVRGCTQPGWGIQRALWGLHEQGRMGWGRVGMEWVLGRRELEQDGREQGQDGREQHDVHDVQVHDVQVHDGGHDVHILLSMGIDLF